MACGEYSNRACGIDGSATLYVDDIAVGMAPGAGPYSFRTDAELALGEHAIRIEVTDGRNVKSAAIAVTAANRRTWRG